MTAGPHAYEPALERAKTHALEWLTSLQSRPVGPQQDADELAAVFGRPWRRLPPTPRW
ncbi:hypothetical protein BJ997_002134 [Cryobacterium roopkundense]|uniref:Uncharacterized protein n=1 Tax=Cryobacterium roopkundense TaxID=1001240 RepID=A0A7W9E3Z9_9MICO|nr:hypothetical protein [Cryobacterium roopkundense]